MILLLVELQAHKGRSSQIFIYNCIVEKEKKFTLFYVRVENDIIYKCLLLVYVSIYIYFSKKERVHFDVPTSEK